MQPARSAISTTRTLADMHVPGASAADVASGEADSPNILPNGRQAHAIITGSRGGGKRSNGGSVSTATSRVPPPFDPYDE
jgi:hypothetical protein